MSAYNWAGRVSAVAVAVGLSVAVATSPGIAHADSEDSPSASAGSGPAADTTADSSTDPSEADDASESADAPSDDGDHSADAGNPTDADAATDADEPVSESDPPAPDTAEPADGEADENAETDEAADSDVNVDSEANAVAPESNSNRGKASVDRRPVEEAASDAEQGAESDGANGSDEGGVDADEHAGATAAETTAPAAEVQLTDRPADVATPSAAAALTPVTLSPRRGLFSGLMELAAGVVDTVFDVISGPVDPERSPMLWAVLAYVRRDFKGLFVNEAPQANPYQLLQTATGTVVGSVNAADVDGDDLRYKLGSGPSRGVVTIGADGRFTYTPNGAFAASGGTDTFTVTVRDIGFRLFAPARQISVPVTVTVTPVNPDNPVTVINGGAESEIAVTPDGKYAYVVNPRDRFVTVIDAVTNTLVTTIPGELRPADVVINRDGTRVYVANSGDASVSVIDTATNTVLERIEVGGEPMALAISPDSSRVYVVNSDDDTLSVINAATNRVVRTIAVGELPMGVALSADGRRAYVVNSFDGSVSVIDTATNRVIDVDSDTDVVDAIDVGRGATEIAVGANGRAYVVNGFDDSVSVIDLATNTLIDVDPSTAQIDALAVGDNPTDVALSPDGTRLAVLHAGAGGVMTFDAATFAVVDQLVTTNVADAAFTPANALFIAGGVVDVPTTVNPNACTPGFCSTEGFYVYNHTPYPVLFLGYRELARSGPLGGGPADTRPVRSALPGIVEGASRAVGSILLPGQSVEVQMFAFYSLNPNAEAVFQTIPTEGAGVGAQKLYAQFRIGFGLGNYPLTQCAGNASCEPSGQLTLGRDVFLHFPRNVTIDDTPENARVRANFINELCGAGGRGACQYQVVASDTEEAFVRREIPTQSGLSNGTSVPITRTVKVTQEESQSTSLEITSTTKAKFGKDLESTLTTKYGQTWASKHTFEETLPVTVAPFTRLEVYADVPVYRTRGNLVITVGGSTITLLDVVIDTPNRGRAMNVGFREVALNPVPAV